MSLSLGTKVESSACGTTPIRVMICDDSAVIRSILSRVLSAEADVEVVARAVNGREALDQITAKPGLAEVVVLDIEMPVMDGLTAIPLLLKASAGLRIIMASTLTTRGALTTLEALRLGAADYVAKPSATAISGDADFRRELLSKVRAIGRRPKSQSVLERPSWNLRQGVTKKPRLLAIGSSTGGPQALTTLLQGLKVHLGPAGLPIPVVLTQHMPPSFTPLLAEQLSRLGGFPCSEATDGHPLASGQIVIAPGGRHLLVHRDADSLVSKLDDGPAENFCRPSVDPMLRSAADACNGRVLMVMLTGMGHDGLEGTKALVTAGGTVLAQDELTSVVWGMPGAVARAGLCRAVLPLSSMAEHVAQLLRAGP